MELQELEKKVIEWADEKGILAKATPLAQVGKTEEEVMELHEALIAQNNNLQTYINGKGKAKDTSEEIKDAIGDIMVTIIIQAKMQNLTLQECLESAYNVIKERKGKMINGTFVKDE